MKRFASIVAAAALLGGCGGGGSSPAPATPSTPAATTAVRFVVKVPPGAKQMHARLHRMYVSPATLGVGITYAPSPATFTNAQLSTPNVAFDLSSCGSNCTANSDGTKTYVLNAPIPGSATPYTIEIVTWDSTPTGGSFSGNSLSQQIVSSQTIAPGSTGTTIAISLDGVPANVSFVPVPGQTHVVNDGNTWDVVGSAPVKFVYNALDADGYIIASSDPGAPSLAASDPSGQFTIAYSGTSNIYTVHAVSASAGATSVTLTATPVAGSGISTLTNSVSLQPVQEVWSATTAGGPPAGLLGYAMFPPAKEPSTYPLDFLNISTTQYNIRGPAIDANGNIYLNNLQNSGPAAGVYQLTPPSYSSTAAFVNASAPTVGTGSSSGFSSIAIDSSNYILTVATNGGTFGYGGLYAYNSAGVLQGSVNSNGSGPANLLQDVTVANGAADGGAIKDQVWVAGGGGVAAFTAAPSLAPVSLTMPQNVASATALLFDSNGYLWVTDGGSLYVYQITGSAASPTATQVATLPSAGVFTSKMGATAQGTVWIPEGSTTPYATEWKMTCAPSCTISQVGGTFSTAATNFSMVVEP